MSSFFSIKKTHKGSQKKPLFIVVGKTVFKKATERNKTKRRIRYITKPLLKDLNYDVVIIVKKSISQLNFKDLQKEILYTFKHERIIF